MPESARPHRAVEVHSNPGRSYLQPLWKRCWPQTLNLKLKLAQPEQPIFQRGSTPCWSQLVALHSMDIVQGCKPDSRTNGKLYTEKTCRFRSLLWPLCLPSTKTLCTPHKNLPRPLTPSRKSNQPLTEAHCPQAPVHQRGSRIIKLWGHNHAERTRRAVVETMWKPYFRCFGWEPVAPAELYSCRHCLRVSALWHTRRVVGMHEESLSVSCLEG